MAATIRRAIAADQDTVRAIVLAERLNPRGLDWPNFVVAEEGGQLVGVAQCASFPTGHTSSRRWSCCLKRAGRG
jgi:hypothetical protein